MTTPRLVTKTIRGLDLDLYKEAHIQAVREGITVGEWINQAIREKLANQKGKT